MEDKALLAVMAYVCTMEEKQKSTLATLETSTTVTTTLAEGATATVTVAGATVNTAADEANPSAAAPTTTEAANLPASAETTTVPPSPEDPVVIQLNKKTRPPSHNTIVTIDPRCFHSDGRTELEATKCQRKSINTIVNSIVENNLTPEQRAFALKQAMVHIRVRGLAKIVGLINNEDYVKKSCILNNMKNVVRLAQGSFQS